MIYAASHVKRQRATREQIDERKGALIDIVLEQAPMTVRQVFYQATVRGLIEKTEAGYNKVQRALVELRRAGALPYDMLADNTRWVRRPRSYSDPASMLRETARLYRKSLWADAHSRVEIWLEKDALAGVVVDVTSEYDVPLMVTRGYASLSFLHSAAEEIEAEGVRTHIYHFGDFDPSGQDAARAIEAELRALAPSADIEFERVAVTEDQITLWNLPTRPTKASDTRAKNFGAVSVELDAIPPDTLRGLVRERIEQHFSLSRLKVLKEAEASEKQWLVDMAHRLGKEVRR